MKIWSLLYKNIYENTAKKSNQENNNMEYEETRRITYGEENAVFIPVCSTCGRFVKADKSVAINESVGLKDQPNATCKKCGRVQMIFEGFI